MDYHFNLMVLTPWQLNYLIFVHLWRKQDYSKWYLVLILSFFILTCLLWSKFMSILKNHFLAQEETKIIIWLCFVLFYFIFILCSRTTKYLKFFQVINDGIGFAGPLLLNKLIKFLQQGFETRNSLCSLLWSLKFCLHL
jgi:hypothetical protein